MADPLSLLAAAVTVGTVGAGVAQQEKSAKQQKKALKLQEQEIKRAEARATSQQRRSEQEMARANAKKPDVSAIMAAAQEASRTGAASTMLTGPQGVDPNALQLGRTSLLGE